MTLGVVVTGGSSGIGHAVVAWFQRAQVATFNLSRRAGTDVTDAAQVAGAYDAAEHVLGGPPPFLVACAGIIGQTPFPETDVAEWRRVIDVNLTGTFIVAREHVARLRRAGTTGAGRIVLFGSASGRRPSLANPAYGSAKAAVTALGLGLARGLEADGIKVYVLCPSHVDTPMLRARGFTDLDATPLLQPDVVADEVGRLLLTPNHLDGQPLYLSAMVLAKQQ